MKQLTEASALLLALFATGCGEGSTLPPPSVPPPAGRLYFGVITHEQGVRSTLPYSWDAVTGSPEKVPLPFDLANFPTIAPDGRRLVFFPNFYLTTFDVVTRESRYLTSGFWLDHKPRWSPDGRGIMVQRDAFLGEPSKLVLVQADGSGEREIHRFPPNWDSFRSGSWSADAKYFYSVAPDRDLTVERLRIDDPAAPLDTVAIGPKVWEINPHTGQAAALYQRQTAPDSVELSLWDPATGQYTHVGNIPTNPRGGSDYAAWSPDGRYVAVLNVQDTEASIAIFDSIERRLVSRRMVPSNIKVDNLQPLSWGPTP